MINWFQEVFSSSSDKARLVAIIISAVVAIGILLLNQWFTNRRERKKIISEKIEEMHLTSIEYTNSAHQILKDLQTQKHRDKDGSYSIDQVVYGTMNDSIRKMEMLSGLYFPEINFNPKDYSINNMPIVDAAITGELTRGNQVDMEDLYLISRGHIDKAEEKLTNVCKVLMKKQMI